VLENQQDVRRVKIRGLQNSEHGPREVGHGQQVRDAPCVIIRASHGVTNARKVSTIDRVRDGQSVAGVRVQEGSACPWNAA
jgi:hypothetical protein